jgi:hypothetical protein
MFVFWKELVAVIELGIRLSWNWLYEIITQQKVARMISETKHLLVHCDNDFRQTKPIDNLPTCLSPANIRFELLSVQGVGSVSGRSSQDSRIVGRIKRCITKMVSFIVMLLFLYITR